MWIVLKSILLSIMLLFALGLFGQDLGAIYQQELQKFQCALNKTSSGCPSTQRLARFQIQTITKPESFNASTLAATTESLTKAAIKEWETKPGCMEGYNSCLRVANSSSGKSGINKDMKQYMQDLKNEQSIVQNAQKAGDEMRKSIAGIETLKEGETIGLDEKVGDSRLTLDRKSLPVMDDWQPTDSSESKKEAGKTKEKPLPENRGFISFDSFGRTYESDIEGSYIITCEKVEPSSDGKKKFLFNAEFTITNINKDGLTLLRGSSSEDPNAGSTKNRGIFGVFENSRTIEYRVKYSKSLSKALGVGDVTVINEVNLPVLTLEPGVKYVHKLQFECDYFDVEKAKEALPNLFECSFSLFPGLIKYEPFSGVEKETVIDSSPLVELSYTMKRVGVEPYPDAYNWPQRYSSTCQTCIDHSDEYEVTLVFRNKTNRKLTSKGPYSFITMGPPSFCNTSSSINHSDKPVESDFAYSGINFTKLKICGFAILLPLQANERLESKCRLFVYRGIPKPYRPYWDIGNYLSTFSIDETK